MTNEYLLVFLIDLISVLPLIPLEMVHKNKKSENLTNRVRGSYCKLWTEFFRHRFMAQAQSARGKSRREETWIRKVQTEKTWLVRYLLYLNCMFTGLGNDLFSFRTKIQISAGLTSSQFEIVVR